MNHVYRPDAETSHQERKFLFDFEHFVFKATHTQAQNSGTDQSAERPPRASMIIPPFSVRLNATRRLSISQKDFLNLLYIYATVLSLVLVTTIVLRTP